MRKVKRNKGSVFGEGWGLSGDCTGAGARPFPPPYVLHSFPLFLPWVMNSAGAHPTLLRLEH